MIPFVTFVSFDTETTGLDPNKDEIIELAGVKFTLEKKDQRLVAKTLATYSSLVKPSMFIPADATRVNNITNQMVENAPQIKTVLQGFFKFAGLSSILIAHNAPFDNSFISRAIKKNGLILPKNPVIDSLKLFKKILPEATSMKLSEVARKLSSQINLQLSSDQLHRALYDCEVLKEVVTASLRKRFQEKELAMDQALQNLEKIHGPSLTFQT